MAYTENVPEQSPPSPGVKIDKISGQSDGVGPDTEKFYHKDIGVGAECITPTPDVGDYEDDDVSRPDGPLFDGPQAYPSAKLHSGVDSEK